VAEPAIPRNGSDGAAGREGAPRLTAYQIATLVALAAMVVLVVGFDLNIGVVSMALAAVLASLQPREGMAALSRVSWPVVVLIAGVLTYIAVLQRAGTVEWVSSGISAISIPLVAALLLFYVSGFVSSLASSLGVIGVVIALAVPFLQSGDVNVAGFVAALGISATIVDISPFSTNGAMLLANVNADIRDWYYKRMLGYAALMCLIGPGLAWFVAAVPTWAG
jgi:di/tricarboxylate transporter